MRFDEIWIQQDQLARIAELAKLTTVAQGAVIEVGTWQGLSAISIANAINPDILHVVDHWKGSPDIPREKSDRDNFSIFQENMGEATQGNYRVHREDWREFVKTWGGPIRFLHLDADHGADDVEQCLRALLPRAVVGGIFAGDDWNWPTVREGVLRVIPASIIDTFNNKLWWVMF